MKMTKRIIALMIAVMMVTVFAVSTASAAAVVDKFEVKEFSVLNSELAAGNVTVNVTLERIEGGNNDEVEVSVISAIYSGTAMVDVAASTKTYIFNGTIQENKMELNIPQGTVDPQLRVFLWDGNMITPLGKSSDEASVEGIIVGGDEIDFVAGTTEYTVDVGVAAPEVPEITIISDGIIRVDTTWNENVATVVAGNETYTITYNKAVEPAPYLRASYAGAKDYANSNLVTDTQILRDPSEAIQNALDNQTLSDIVSLNIPSGYSDYEGRIAEFKKMEEHANLLYNDTWSIIWDVPDELIGKTRLVYDYFYGTSWDNYNCNYSLEPWIITINKDTRIWCSSRTYQGANSVKYLGADGVVGGDDDVNVPVTVTDLADDFKFLHLDRTVTSPNTFGQYKNETISILNEKLNDDRTIVSGGPNEIVISEAVLTVPEGQESATYAVGAFKTVVTYKRDAESPYISQGANYVVPYPAIFCYEFIEDDEEEVVPPLATITNATLERGASATSDYSIGSVTVIPTVYYDTGATNDEGEKLYGLGEAGLSGSTGAATIFANYATRMDADTRNYGHYFPAEMLGARGALWFSNFTINGELAPELTFTINGDATLYFDTTDEFVAKSGAVRMDDYIGVYGGGSSYSAICGVSKTESQKNGKGTPFHGGRLFKLELKVPEGQTTATFTVPLAWGGPESDPQNIYEYPFAYIK